MNRRNFIGKSILAAGLLTGCGKKSPEIDLATDTGTEPHKVTTILSASDVAAAPQITSHPIRFTDVSHESGIRWKFENGATGLHLAVESTGGGVAFLDYNNDGLLDIFAVQGGPVPGAVGNARNFSTKNVLYRNNGDGTFTDVTESAGLGSHGGYGQGVSVADYNNDGFADIYVTAYGGNSLFRNNGNGTFADVTEAAGLRDLHGITPWPLSSGWADFNNDGHLDLFVCHYAEWTPQTNKPCKSTDGQPAYCRPEVYPASHCSLFRNNGDGTFTDISVASGISSASGKSMGVSWFDYDDDGWMDIFVTNDTMVNSLFHNNRDGTFTDLAIRAGVAYGTMGHASSGMGVGTADFTESGRQDLIFVNFANEPKAIMLNTGDGLFSYDSDKAKVSSSNLEFLGFGVDCLDYDNDAYIDFVVGNGHVLDHPDPADAEDSYSQSQQLFHNQGDGTFIEDVHSLGDLVNPRVTRGLAVGDFNNDGAVDVLMVSQTGPLQLYRNDGGNLNNWIGLRLEGVASNRDAIGSKIKYAIGGKVHYRRVNGGGSYCSYSDRRLNLGLKEHKTTDYIEVTWPTGKKQRALNVQGNAHYIWREGEPIARDPRIKSTF